MSGLYGGVAPLANVARLTQLIDRCNNRAAGLPGMGCYSGRAGYGKTTGAIYATNSLSAVHVEALPFGGLLKLMQMIVAELGHRPGRTVSALFDQACEDLARSGRTLIIDEADHILRDSMIEAVRSLHDRSGAPVILMGEEQLPQRLQRWERVHGRIMAWTAAEPATADDVTHLARVYCEGVELAPDLRAAVLEASRGSIRYVSTNLAALREFALVRDLRRLARSDWQGEFHTGEPPATRRTPVATLPAERRRAGGVR